MTLANLPDSVGILEILRLLARQRSVVTYSGSEFRTVLRRLAFLEQQVLMELIQERRPSGYLLMQRGWVVFAQQGVLTGQAAAEQLAAGAARSTLRLFALGAAPAALAFASIEAAPTEPDDEEYRGLSARLTRLSQRQFSGVIAVRDRERVQIWQLQTGEVTAQQELLKPETFGPFVQLAWSDRNLPRLTLRDDDPQSEDGTESLSASYSPSTAGSARAVTANAAGPATPQISRAGQNTGSTDLVWSHFQDLLNAHLGEAGLRLYSVIRSQHASNSGATLLEALGRHIDRVAGRPAGLEFRSHVAPVPTSLEGSL